MASHTVASRPIAVYTRVSEQGDRSDEELLSHEIQRRKVEAYLESRGLRPARETFKDNNKSGGKMSRPAFDKALQGIRDGKYSGIAVYHLSRFGRNTRGVLALIEELQELGASFICLTPNVDTSTPEGRAMLTVFSAFYTLEREQAVEKARDTMALKIAAGTTTGGRPAPGYRFEVVGKDSNGKDLLGWLEPEPDTFEKVREIRLAYASGKLATPGKVADALNAAGVTTSKGNIWNAQNVRGFLRNPVYAGQADGNRSHEAMHDDVTQRVILRRVEPKTRRTVVRGDGHLLGQGLCKCSTCGKSLTRGVANGSYQTLRCNQRGPGHASVSYGHLAEWVVSSAFIHGVDLDGMLAGITSLHSRTQLEARVAEALAEVERIESEIGTTLPANSVQRKALAAAEDALYQADAERVEGDVPVIVSRGAFDALDLAGKIKALRALVAEVVVAPGQKGVKNPNLVERVVIRFHDGSQYPAAPETVKVPDLAAVPAPKTKTTRPGRSGAATKVVNAALAEAVGS